MKSPSTKRSPLGRSAPDGAAALRDLQRIRNTYVALALAGAAKGLRHATFPAHAEPTPLALPA